MVPNLPRIFLLPTHLRLEELHRLEDNIPTLTYDAHEADVVVGNISKRERALFELRRLRIETEPMDVDSRLSEQGNKLEQPVKRRKVSVSDESGVAEQPSKGSNVRPTDFNHLSPGASHAIIAVVKLSWLIDCLEQDVSLPIDKYLLCQGYKLPIKRQGELRGASSQMPSTKQEMASTGGNIRLVCATTEVVERTGGNQPGVGKELNPADSLSVATTSSPSAKVRHSGYGAVRRYVQTRVPTFYHETTSEHENMLPPIPDFLHTTYSCQRPSPINPPNVTFIEELKDVRTLRRLQGDQIGVRAYSTSIATLTAYPYIIQRRQEIARLPGCSTKIADLYQQWAVSGRTSETKIAEENQKLTVLKKFFNIWGVGDATAREFYKKGWRDLDDIIENGWESLTRVQQIGIKFYDEFQLKIPRAEVESISTIILRHACQIEPGFQMVIVGGYRRGKLENSDVDVVLSHPDESKTLDVIEKVVLNLEKKSYITHTLVLWTRNSERGQSALAWKGEDNPSVSGFDTLDKALVVWREPSSSSKHRRVDIIISPWKTVGCAVLGWSGGTTFQRDLRRYCKKEKGLKFDSSGIRSRKDGSWVDLERSGTQGAAPDMESAERRVFDGLGLPWRPPEERCTG